MSLTLPLRVDLTDYDYTVALDGTSYLLRYRWNRRESAWYLDVSEENGTPIRVGLKVVVDLPLGFRCRDARWWPGVLVAVDNSGAHADPGISDLGDRVQLLYFEASELV